VCAVRTGNASFTASTKALSSADCAGAAALASRGGEDWFSWYYAHAGLFVGDLDPAMAESIVEKQRVDLGRSFSDVMLLVLALKGDWALVLANQAREEQASKRNATSKTGAGPRNRFADEGVEVNADGTPKTENQALIDARKLQRTFYFSRASP
jgi:hypothetical protein